MKTKVYQTGLQFADCSGGIGFIKNTHLQVRLSWGKLFSHRFSWSALIIVGVLMLAFPTQRAGATEGPSSVRNDVNKNFGADLNLLGEARKAGEKSVYKLREEFVPGPHTESIEADASSLPELNTRTKTSKSQSGQTIESARLELINLPEKKSTVSQTSILKQMQVPTENLSGPVPTGSQAGNSVPETAEEVSSLDVNTLRQTLRKAAAQDSGVTLSHKARKTGSARLMADRQALLGQGTKPGGDTLRSISTNSPAFARKTLLLPLPSEKSIMEGCRRRGGIERLTEAKEKADNPDETDRLSLRLAAAHVGAGDLNRARAIYKDLAQNANLKSVRQTALRNLKILAEENASIDPGGKERSQPPGVHPSGRGVIQ